jgi:hypothetical protein
MAIRKRSVLLLGIVGFFSGVAFMQYRRNRFVPYPQPREKPLWNDQKALPAVPMQTMDQALATARMPKNRSDYTTH